MGENASRYQQAPVRADVYWRRRVVALAIGLAIVGLISWAVNGTLSTPASPGAAAAGAAPGGGAGGGSGGAGLASGSPAASRGSRAASTPSTGPAGRAAGRTSAAGRSRQAGTSGSPQVGSHQGGWHQRGSPAACPPGDVVLSLRQPQASYSGRAWPQFEVDVVSTAARPCAFNTGPRFLSVVVRSGRHALWTSAACSGGNGSNLAVLTKGVPVTLHFWWDRRAGSSGCQGQGRQVRAGAFVATAVSGRMSSNSLIFVLRAHGAAVP